MKNKNSTLFQITGVLGMIIGILTVIILIGIPIIIGAIKYLEWAKMSDEEVVKQKDSIMVWGIVLGILLFPIGLIALIPAFNLEGQLSNAVSNASNSGNKEDLNSKLEKIKKLHELKEQGILDEEDFKIAKEKILKED